MRTEGSGIGSWQAPCRDSYPRVAWIGRERGTTPCQPSLEREGLRGSALGEAGDGGVDHLLVGPGVELVADQSVGGGGGGGRGLGADLVERGAPGGGDLVLGHAGAALDQSGGVGL